MKPNIDVLYIAKNRLEFTKASLTTLMANTDWSLVNKMFVYDDGSTDGTLEWMQDYLTSTFCVDTLIVRSSLGGPAEIMRDFTARHGEAELFAKIDNDVIVPRGWLGACWDVMAVRPELGLLGIEPPESRTPRSQGGARSRCPEHAATLNDLYAPCESIGGIGLMRRDVFVKYGDRMAPHSTYGGFTEFQVMQTPDVVKGWITPPLRVFLLDRLPTEPWAALSRAYITKGWQRPWSGYDPANPFWSWWTPETESFPMFDGYTW